MKDPAFLFYANDFDTATKFFTHEQVGIYLRLLISQFQHGRLSEKQILHISGSLDPEIMCKFRQDEKNLYYNPRLEEETQKRKLFTESRRKNAKGTTKTSVKDVDKHMLKHMVDHMENENENENTIVNRGFIADKSHMSMSLTDTQIGAAIQYVQITKQKAIDREFVLNLWEVFKIKEYTGKWYKDEGACFSHFLNTLKYEKFDEVKPKIKTKDTKSNLILNSINQ